MESPQDSIIPPTPATTTEIQPVVLPGVSVMPEAPAYSVPEKRGRGRPRKDGSPRPAPALAGTPGNVVLATDLDQPEPEAVTEDAMRAAARNYVLTFTVAGATVLGVGFIAKGSESQAMEEALVDYFRENGIQKPPAWLGIVIAVGSYTATKIMTDKEVKEKFFSLLGKTGIYKPELPKRIEDKPLGK